MKFFGYFSWMPYEDSNEDFEVYKTFKNAIPKNLVVQHMESLEVWATSLPNKDYFTGERLQSGLCEDGDFVFPLDFIHYYKNYDIGVPYEYEEYLKNIMDG